MIELLVCVGYFLLGILVSYLLWYPIGFKDGQESIKHKMSEYKKVYK